MENSIEFLTEKAQKKIDELASLFAVNEVFTGDYSVPNGENPKDVLHQMIVEEGGTVFDISEKYGFEPSEEYEDLNAQDLYNKVEALHSSFIFMIGKFSDFIDPRFKNGKNIQSNMDTLDNNPVLDNFIKSSFQ